MWDDYNGPVHFVGKLPVDMNSPPVKGEAAKLTREEFEFDVRINSVEGNDLSGIVTHIGPEATTEALGVKRNDLVSFHSSHIKVLYRE